jgi:hypothetical protein
MSWIFDNFGWLSITLAVPAIAPLFGVLVFAILPIPNKSPLPLSLLQTVKDAQLCWAAIAYCASALYEIYEPSDGKPVAVHGAVGSLTAGAIILLLISSMVAAGGATFPTPIGVPQNTKWWKHYSALLNSIWITVLSAALYAVIHYGILR